MKQEVDYMKNSFMLPHVMKLANISNWPNAAIVSAAQVNEYIPWLCKLPFDYLYRDAPEDMAECSLLVQEYVGLDLLSTNLDVYNFEAESIGAKIRFYPDHIPDIDRSEYLIQSEDDFDKIVFRGLDSGRWPYLLRYMDAFKEYSGFDYYLMISSPWSLACNLYGLENIVIDCMTEPEFVHKFMAKIVKDLHVPIMIALHEKYPELKVVNMADAFASPPMVSLDIAHEFILPYIEMERKLLAPYGMDVSVGGIWGISKVAESQRDEFMDFLTAVSGNQVFAFDPDLEEIGPEYFRDYANRKKAVLFYGLSNTFLQTASEEEIIKRVKDLVFAGKNSITPCSFFFNNFAPGTPIGNIHAAIKTVETYGAPDADENTKLVIPEKESFESFLKYKMQNNVEGYRFHWLEHSEYKGIIS